MKKRTLHRKMKLVTFRNTLDVDVSGDGDYVMKDCIGVRACGVYKGHYIERTCVGQSSSPYSTPEELQKVAVGHYQAACRRIDEQPDENDFK